MIRSEWGGIRARHFLGASKSLIRSSQEIDSPVLRRPVRSQTKFFFSKLSFLDFDQIRLQPFISYFLLTVYTPFDTIIRHKEVWFQIRYPFLTPKITGYSKPWHLLKLPIRVVIALYHMWYVGSITAWPKWWSQPRRCQHHGELMLDTYPCNHGLCCGHVS